MREWEVDFWHSFFERKIKDLKSGYIEEVDLTHEDICPENVIDTLRAMGYEDDDYDVNGWEQDTWIYFTKGGEESLMLFYCGRTFKMNLSICPEED